MGSLLPVKLWQGVSAVRGVPLFGFLCASCVHILEERWLLPLAFIQQDLNSDLSLYWALKYWAETSRCALCLCRASHSVGRVIHQYTTTIPGSSLINISAGAW